VVANTGVADNCDILVSQHLFNSKEQTIVLTIEAAEELIKNLNAAIRFAKDGGYEIKFFPIDLSQ